MEIEELDALAGKEATVRARWRLSARVMPLADRHLYRTSTLAKYGRR